MLITIRYTLINLIKTPGILIWTLVFPLVLSTVFVAMFSSIDKMAETQTVRVVVVSPPKDSSGVAFYAFLDEVGTSAADDDGGRDSTNDGGRDANPESSLLDITYVATEEEAKTLVVDHLQDEQPYVGYVVLRDGLPEVFVIGKQSASGSQSIGSSILSLVMNAYSERMSLVGQLAADNPAALENSLVLKSLGTQAQVTQQVQLTLHHPQETVRFYFALLGMAALFGGSVGIVALQLLKPNISSLGARRAVGAMSHSKSVAGTIIACWIVCFTCLCVTFAYLRFVVQIDFGGQDAAALVILALASLLATALGCAISSIPKIPEDGKNGILTGVVCFASLFAGLYGQPTMELADAISKQVPALDLINPATQISQAFYSITYYDSYEPLIGHLLIMAIMTFVFFVLSVQSLRRQRYASL